MKTRASRGSGSAAKLVLALMLGALGATAAAAPGASPPGLFKQAQVPSHVNLPPQAMAGRSRFAEADLGQLQSHRLRLNLFPDVDHGAWRERLVENANGSRVWVGKLEDVPDSEVTLAASGNALAGTVRIGRELYAVRYSGDGVQSISQVSSSDPLPELDPIPVAADLAGPTGGSAEGTGPVSDAASVVDVLVLYTPSARARQGGTDGIDALVALAVEETNQAYLNSGVGFRIQLAHSAEVAYTESGSMATDLDRLRTIGDGLMDDAHMMRDAYSADLVSLIAESSQYCGLGYQMTQVGTAFESSAFTVVASQCATGYYSFGHELGHNMGSAHDRLSASIQPALAYGYGYQDPGAAFRTVMAYDCYGGCTRIQHFSNPYIVVGAVPTGVDYALDPANAADNARALSETMGTVAAFRDAATAAPPAAPSGLSAYAPAPDRVEISWTDNAANELGFRLERSTDGGVFTEIASLTRNTTSHVDTGLEMATRYTYRAKAYNGLGDSVYSNSDTALTPDPSLASEQLAVADIPVAGEVYGDYRLTWAEDSSMEVIEEVQSKGKPGVRYGYLEHKWAFDLSPASGHTLAASVSSWTSGAGERFSFAYSTDDLTYTPMFTLGPDQAGEYGFDLPAGLSGRIYVRVTDEVRNGGEATAHRVSVNSLYVRSMTLADQPPLAPSGLTAVPLSAGEIALGWTDNAWSEEGYRIETSTDAMSWEWVANAPADASAYTHGGLSPQSLHHYRVRAFNASGASAFTAPVSATTGESAPITLEVSAARVKGESTVELSWSGVPGATADLYRNGSPMALGMANDGSHADVLGKHVSGDFTYRVCEAGSETACSADASLSF